MLTNLLMTKVGGPPNKVGDGIKTSQDFDRLLNISDKI